MWGGSMNRSSSTPTTVALPASTGITTWKPSFISVLSQDDRSHLNGMGSRDGKLVCACAETDEPLAWKAQKSGGVLIDVQSNEIITRGLSMPHSPRPVRNRPSVPPISCRRRCR